MSTYDYDVIIVGSGMSGGIAAKEFCEKGYKTLVLDRGKPLEHRHYKTENVPPWEMAQRGQKLSKKELEENYPVNQHCYILNEYTKGYMLKDVDHKYVQKKPFNWYRSSSVGGKSLLWARQVYRWNEIDFEANKKDGHGIDWPIRYQDVEPWYDYIEPFVGVSGSVEQLDILPDSKFLPAHPLNVVEREAKQKVEQAFPGRKIIPSRVAHLTAPQPIHTRLGRAQCQARSECQRGCSWGGYYSSLAGGLAAAKLTNNMTLTANAQVQKVLLDEKTGKTTGVQYIDTETLKAKTVSAKLVFMCASTVASVQILLNSTSKTYPNGIGNNHDVLGRYITDHVGGAGASGTIEGHLDSYYKGRRPSGIYVPRFRNINKAHGKFLRGFGYQGGAGRSGWRDGMYKDGIGAEFKQSNQLPGNWYLTMWGFGEMLPRYENRMYLDKEKTDIWGLPQPVMDVAVNDNEVEMQKDMEQSAIEMLTAAGATNISSGRGDFIPGSTIHEMGGAVMGRDPKTSYLNKWNQCHEVANLFVTDGSAFPSQSCVNPSLTFMALTARAVDYADKQLKAGKL
ncbi:GMC oxidoreductase [Thalassotalea agarivorans]|uniref:Choline dehydrogenase n=1 Tax=Thalassotalea agarivorans TaxID=349064 RepID=A0A1H9Y8I1_THASX|nr:GMC family oxidoreductase [Thalassotalea agarivorans]SES64733.1 Choline dehydrogenase [Thalassotalea agarivorans]